MPHVFSGGVLPIRRFVITGGEEIVTDGNEDRGGLQCNNQCWENEACQAWQFDRDGCRWFADKEEEALYLPGRRQQSRVPCRLSPKKRHCA